MILTGCAVLGTVNVMRNLRRMVPFFLSADIDLISIKIMMVNKITVGKYLSVVIKECQIINTVGSPFKGRLILISPLASIFALS